MSQIPLSVRDMAGKCFAACESALMYLDGAECADSLIEVKTKLQDAMQKAAALMLTAEDVDHHTEEN